MFIFLLLLICANLLSAEIDSSLKEDNSEVITEAFMDNIMEVILIMDSDINEIMEIINDDQI